MTIALESVALERSTDPYDPRTNAENFDLQGWLATFDPRILTEPAATAGRIALTRLDPMLFAFLYLRKHLVDPLGNITFADAHFLWVRWARRLIGPSRGPRADRRALVAPRACGKTTWFFLIIPLWAGAHGHTKFAAAFADSGAQAELHLATFKRELSDNEQLRRDFLDFCEPARRHNGKTINDSQQMLYTKTGFAFAARGIDSTSLGMKVDQNRPDLIIFDDVEPPEGTYSTFQKGKRLSTITNAVLPLNERARVVLIGTVTMPGSIVHELVRANKGEETADWISEEQFRTHHTMPVLNRPDGSERSVWPEKWSMEYLGLIRHTRSYKLNFENDPRGRKGDLWSADDIRYGLPPNINLTYLFVDPPVTTHTKSDPCGLAVVSYAPGTLEPIGQALAAGMSEHLGTALLGHELASGRPSRLPRVVVRFADEARLTGTPLRDHILQLLVQFPDISKVVLESNQGGDLWHEIMVGLPVPFRTHTATEPKEVRFGRALDFYQKNRATHERVFNKAEDQMTGFPRVEHDDIADAIATGVLYFLTPKKRRSQRNQTIHPS